MTNEVFNNSIGAPFSFHYPNLTKEEDQQIIASLFEQILIFDKVSISTNRINFALTFLIDRLGINTVEQLLDCRYIQFVLWTPAIFTSTGQHRADGTIDESTIYGQPPLGAATLMGDDIDPENNIKKALANFSFHKDRQKIFIRKALNNYIVPNGMEFSADSAKLVINSYQNNCLAELGLPFEKDPNQLNLEERKLLLNLSHKVIESAILSKYHLKSFDNYDHLQICKQNIANIGKAYNISENSSVIFKLENLPNLSALYLQGKLDFNSVFKIRYLSNAKYYRKWINEIGENSNSQEVTSEYLKEIRGISKFFETGEGKLTKNLGLFGINAALGTAIAGPAGTVAGFAFGLLETFWLDNILKGKNPSMFIESIKSEIVSK